MKNVTRFASTLAVLVLAAGSMVAPSASAAQLAAPDGIPVGSLPLDVAFSSNGKLAFVTNRESDNVSVINTKSKTVIKTIAVGDEPLSIERSKNNRVMYVTNIADHSVSVIDIKRQRVTRTADIPIGTTSCRLTPKGDYLACPTEGSPFQLNFVKTSTMRFHHDVYMPGGSYDVDFSKDGKTAYVVPMDTATIVPINLKTGVAGTAIPIGNNAGWPAPSPDKTKLYVPSFDDNVVTVVSMVTNTAIATITMSDECVPSSAAAKPRGRYMYVTCFGTGWVEAIDMSTNTLDVTKRVETESGIDGIAVNRKGTQAFVTNPMTNEVWVLKNLD
jgi:YVTN family beta-propeller protein